MNKQEQMRTILYGVAVGDALGFPYQFKSRQIRKKHPVVDNGVTMDHLGNRIELDDSKKGLWSDDTSLTLCLAESLARGYDLKDMAEGFVMWLDAGYLSSQDDAFDVGHQTRVAIGELKNILAKEDKQKLLQILHQNKRNVRVDTNGNGALMRILPMVTYIYHLELKEQYRFVREVSTLTHPNIVSVICCFLYLKIAERLIDKVSLTEAVALSQQEIRDFAASPDLCFKPDVDNQNQLFRLLNKDLSQGIIEPDDWDKEDYIRSDGYVVSSLEAALWCLLNCGNYRDTVLQAVNLGDDTDSVAAIAGGLAALHYGYEDIPQEWIATLRKPEIFERILGMW